MTELSKPAPSGGKSAEVEERIIARQQEIAQGMPPAMLKRTRSDIESILYKNYPEEIRSESYSGWSDADLETYLNAIKKLMSPGANPEVEKAIAVIRLDLSQGGMSMDDLADIENSVEAILYENDPERLRDKLYPGWSDADLESYMRGMENL